MPVEFETGTLKKPEVENKYAKTLKRDKSPAKQGQQASIDRFHCHATKK